MAEESGASVTRIGTDYTGGGGSGSTGSGGGPPSGGDMNYIPIKDYIDSQDEKTRAQNEVKFADVMSELRSIRENSIGWKGVWGAVATGFIAVGGLLLGALSFGGDRFDGGMSAGAVLEESRKNTAAISLLIEATDDRDQQIQSIVDSLRKISDEKP